MSAVTHYPVNVDPRVGSEDLYTKLGALDVPAQLIELEFGDFSWLGNLVVNGEVVDEVLCGVERKNLRDFISSMREERLTKQIAGMMRSYQVRYLLIEGEWRENDEGYVEEIGWDKKTPMTKSEVRKWQEVKMGLSRRVNAGEMHGYIASAVHQAGIKLVETRSDWETARWIKREWSWWQKTNHKSIGVGGIGGAIGDAMENWRTPEGEVVKPGLAWRAAKQISGVGRTKSYMIAKHFKSLKRMANATVEDWMKIDGIARKSAERVVAEIEEEQEL